MLAELSNIVVTNPSPFEWVSTHIQLIGWPAICYVIWKVRGFLTSVTNRACNVESQVNLAMTNHLPHIQSSLERTEGLLRERENILASMDTSLKILVDRHVK